jgi:hypothetical protein
LATKRRLRSNLCGAKNAAAVKLKTAKFIAGIEPMSSRLLDLADSWVALKPDMPLVACDHHDIAIPSRHGDPNVVVLAMQEHVHRAGTQAQVA